MSEFCGCGHCVRERAAALGVGGPPYEHDVWAKIAPPQDFTADDPVKSDTAVREAEAERDAAQAAFEEADAAWRQAVEEHRRALRGQVSDGRGTVMVVDARGMYSAKDQRRYLAEEQLAQRARELDDVRHLAQRRIVEANQAIRRAQSAARARVELAESRG